MRVHNESAFVLHSRAYGETSLLLELFTRHYGKIGAVAKGARKTRSKHGAVLSLFYPLLISWSGKGELVTLTGAEQQGDLPVLTGDAIFCGFYINEILLHLLHRFDPHETLFDDYQSALNNLGRAKDEIALRVFEKHMLMELGYGLVLNHDINDNQAIVANTDYVYIIEKGPVKFTGNKNKGIFIKGSSLLAIAQEEFDDRADLNEIKNLMRQLILHQLGGRTLHSRTLMQSLKSKNKEYKTVEIPSG